MAIQIRIQTSNNKVGGSNSGVSTVMVESSTKRGRKKRLKVDGGTYGLASVVSKIVWKYISIGSTEIEISSRNGLNEPDKVKGG